MTHSAAMASEILPGRTILEALNTDLVCDAINTAMRELFLQIAYGRSQSAFSEDGLAIGAGLEDLGKGLRSQIGTMYGTLKKGPRYLEMAEGYVTGIALNEQDEIIGYKFINFGKFMAYFLINMNYSEVKAEIGMPYEYLPVPLEGSVVRGLDRNGEYVCDAEVTRVQKLKDADSTLLLKISVPKEYAGVVRAIDRKKVSAE